MKRICAAALIAAGFTIGYASSTEAAAPSQHLKFELSRPAVMEHPDVTYKQIFGWSGSRLKMDILQPESSERVPAVVFVTGGGFIAAPKSNYIQQRLHLAEAGYLVASAEYRVVPDGTYKDAVQDVKAAIRYLRAHAAEFNIDPNRIAVMGESAGGYMAAMIGTTNGVKEFDVGENLDQSSDVQAAIDIYGLSDLTKVGADFSREIQESHRSAGASEALFVNGIPPFGKGGSIESNPESARAANPMTYISGKTASFLLMHGDKDHLVSPSQTQLLHDALTEKGVDSTRYVVEGADHADHYWNQPEVEQVIIAFLDAHLKNK